MTDQETLARATALYQAGNHTAAEVAVEALLAREPNNAAALNLFAVLALESGHAAEAEQLAMRAIAAGGEDLVFLNTLGNSLMAQGRTADALGAFLRAREIAPNHPDILNNLANAQHRAGLEQDAIASYRRCIALRPGYIVAYNNLAVVLKSTGDAESAAAVLIEAIAHAPKSVELRFNLGNALQAAGRLDAAEAAYRRTIELSPSHAEAHVNLGVVLAAVGRKPEAESQFRHAIELNRDLTPAYVGLADLVDDGSGNAVAHRRAVLAIKPDLAIIRSSLLMCMHYTAEATRAELFAEHVAYGRMFSKPAAPVLRRAGTTPPLRLGVISGDFRFHAMLFFALPVFAARDTEVWHLTCYSTTERPDAHTLTFRQVADEWRDVHSISDTALAEIIRRDGIDILIDLSGHAPHNRLPVFATKPAALQVAWGDYIDTRGLDTIDILLGDAVHTPPEDDCFYVEKVLRFAPDYICYAPPSYAPAVAPTPARTNGFITFGCFSEITKISPEAVAQWAAVLNAVTDSRMLLNNRLLADADRQARLIAMFRAEGIGSDRIMFRLGAPHEEFLAQYADVDIILDTAPYSGGLTTCESLLMGVPVLTVTGDRFCGRHASAHLQNGGYPDGVADTVPELVAKAQALAGDIAALERLRSELRPRFLTSTVCDVAAFGQRFYGALRDAWASMPPPR